MWKRLSLPFLLLFSAQMAIAQTTRYEYWADNDYDSRTTATTTQLSVPLELDVSALPSGLHYFNFRTQGTSGQWGGLSRYLFYLKDSETSTARYEYWLDNDYAGRTTADGTPSTAPISIDLNTLPAGLHYFSFRTQGFTGQWGGLSRYLFYLKDNETSTARYEYWLDNDYAGRTTADGTPSAAPISIDLNTLKPGLHYFNFRTQGISGQWGALSRYLFFLKDDVSRFDGIEYWIDSDRKKQGFEQVVDGKVTITVDLTDLPEGNYEFYIHGRSQDGYTLPLDKYDFVLSEMPVVQAPKITHDGNVISIITETENAAIYYTTDGSTPDENANMYEAPFTVEHNCAIKAIATRSGHTASEISELKVNWFKAADVTFAVNDLQLSMATATEDAVIRYTTDGTPPTEDTGLAYGEPLPLATLTDGSTVYALATKENFSSSDVTWFAYRRSDYTVATPTFEEYGNELTISTSTAGASIYYTTDGSDPTTESTLYTSPISLNGNLTVKAIATAEGLFSSEVASHIVGGFQADTPVMALDYATGTLTITCSTAGSSIYYAIGAGSTQLYSGPVMLTDNSTARAWATAEGFNDSGEAALTPIPTGAMGADGGTFTVIGAVTAQELLFLRNVMGQQVEHLDMENATLTDGGLSDEAFSGMSLLTARLPKSIDTVGERLFSGCRRLAAVVWRAGTGPAPTAAVFDGIGNPNLLLYVSSEGIGSSSGVANLVVNQMAREITLSDIDAGGSPAAPSDGNFFCPIPFTATRISYSHVYTQQSGIDGACRGWETLSLPFDVQTVTHRVKGEITPFGTPSPDAGAPHFWLYSLGSTRFEVATAIAANRPYVIAMPQHDGYAAQYCLGLDTITFSATNAAVPVTAPQTSTRYTKSLHANFVRQAESAGIWALNVGAPWEGYAEGSVFVQGLRAVRPFEAYSTTTAAGVRFITLFDDEADGINEVHSSQFDVQRSMFNVQRSMFNVQRSMFNVFDLGGRRTTDGGRRVFPHKRLVIKNGTVRTEP